MLNANLWQQMCCIWLDRLHMAAQGVPMTAHGSLWLLKGSLGVPLGMHMAVQRVQMAAHGVHMATQRLHLGALGAAYGLSEVPSGCPWGSIWLLRGCIRLQRGCILLHRGLLWFTCGRYAVYIASGWARLSSQDPEDMPRWW